MTKDKLIYEGKAKKVYATSDPDLLIQEFKDDATAFNAKKRGTILNKGVVNNAISAKIFILSNRLGRSFISTGASDVCLYQSSICWRRSSFSG